MASADEALPPKWEKLMAIMERLSSAPAPVVNVNVNLDGLLKKGLFKGQDSKVISGKEVDQPDIPIAGGMPRPYVS